MLAGNGRIHALPGSPLARLVGTNPEAVAVLISFDFSATAELAE